MQPLVNVHEKGLEDLEFVQQDPFATLRYRVHLWA